MAHIAWDGIRLSEAAQPCCVFKRTDGLSGKNRGCILPLSFHLVH